MGLRNPEADTDRILQERLEEFNQKGVEVSLEKIEMSQPFYQRVIMPVARSFGQFVIRFTPQKRAPEYLARSRVSWQPLKPGSTKFFSPIQIIMAVFLGRVNVSCVYNG